MSVAAIVIGLAVAFLGASRLFLLLCPTRMWPVLRWTLEPGRDWAQPYQGALVAENAVENGGIVGTWLGRRIYARTVAARDQVPYPDAPVYSTAHLPLPWLATEGVTWDSEAFTRDEVEVKVHVQARIAIRTSSDDNCPGTVPTTTTVDRDYVLSPTPDGWRIVHVYVSYAGEVLPQTSLLQGTPSPRARLLGLC